jgi:hypothetical protein
LASDLFFRVNFKRSFILRFITGAGMRAVPAALPPDVRKGSAFPDSSPFTFEAMPPVRRSLRENKSPDRKAGGFPHISRQSRFKGFGLPFDLAKRKPNGLR